MSEGTTHELPEGPRDKVGKHVSTNVVCVSLTKKELMGDPFFFFLPWSFKYSNSILQISIEDVGITRTSFLASLVTQARLYNKLSILGKEEKVGVAWPS